MTISNAIKQALQEAVGKLDWPKSLYYI
jgi:hypothetical protein